jgi:hypothetical protein
MLKHTFKALSLLSLIAVSTITFAAGQEGDTRIQVNGSLTFAEQGDDTITVFGQMQKYQSDDFVIGGLIMISDTGGSKFTLLGATAKKIFPSQTDLVPYVAGNGLLLSSDFADEFVFSVSGGADMYIDENYGYNFDATKGLSANKYEDLVLSFGMFYEF